MAAAALRDDRCHVGLETQCFGVIAGIRIAARWAIAPVPVPTASLDDGIAIPCEPGVLRGVLERAVAEHASDILLSVGKPPHLRVGGEIVALSDGVITTDALLEFLSPTLTPRARTELDATGSADVAILVSDGGTLLRYRGNIFRQHFGLRRSAADPSPAADGPRAQPPRRGVAVGLAPRRPGPDNGYGGLG